MRTTLEIDDQLMAEVRKLRPGASEGDMVEEGLRLLAQVGRQQQIRELRGKLIWEGDLEAMRNDAA